MARAMKPDARSGAEARAFRDGEVDDGGDEVGQPEEAQRRLMAERSERRPRLERVEVVVRVDRPVREAIESVLDPLGRSVLGTPRQRPSADAVFGGLGAREVATLSGGGGEKVFP